TPVCARRRPRGGRGHGKSGIATVQDVEIAAHVADAGELAGIRLRTDPEPRLLVAAAEIVGLQITRLDMREVGATEIRDRQLTENVVEDRGGHADRIVALDDAGGLEPR